MASSNIFAQYLQRPRSVVDYAAQYDEADARKAGLEARTQQNALQALALRQQTDQFGQAQTERNALQRIAGGWSASTPVDERIASLRNSGMPGLMSQADALEASDIKRRDGESQISERESKASTAKTENLVKQLGVLKSLAGQVFAMPDPQTAMAAIDAYERQTGQSAQEQRDIVSRLQTPDQIKRWAAGLSMQADKLLPQIQTRNTGGTTDTLAIDPVSGVGSVTGSVKNTQSPDSVASNETQRRGQDRQAADAAAGRGVQLKVAGMTDARSREANDINRGLVTQKRQLEVDALQEKADQTKKGKEAATASVVNQIAVIDKALKHPGRATATGLSSTLDPRNFVPGTDATDFRTVLDQIGGAAFLQAFDSLKGGGAITEVEGKKATDAMARLNRAQSDKEFETSLKELRQVMAAGYKRQTGQDLAPTTPTAAKPTRGGPMPKPAKGVDLGDGFTVVN